MDPYKILSFINQEHRFLLEKHNLILSKIFDSKNDEICSNCSQNYKNNQKYHYKKTNGKRHRIYYTDSKIKINESGCCKSCGNLINHYSGFFSERSMTFLSSYKIYEQIKEIFKFNDKTGFFNLKLCKCSIPRILRSDVCLRYYCASLKLSMEDIQQINESTEIIRMIKIINEIPY